jgi:hypothetical protein
MSRCILEVLGNIIYTIEVFTTLTPAMVIGPAIAALITRPRRVPPTLVHFESTSMLDML